MLKRFIPIILFFIASSSLFAQRPENIRLEPSPMLNDDRAMCNNNAGSSTQTLAASSQSNDKLYLCKNDILNIKHSGSFDLSSDPKPSTKAGIGYGWYTCKPTTSGTTLAQITADPCVFKGNPGNPPAKGIFITTQNKLDANHAFLNDGFLQTTYNAGKPVKFTFAPLTFDALSGGLATFEGSPEGPCVNVNINATFDIVYLNAITRSIVSQGDKVGSFKVFGGLSEYDNTNYTIDIALKSNNTIKGTVTSGASKHNGTVSFTTPQNGIYTINIEDGKSCGLTFDMNISSAFEITVVGDTLCEANDKNGVIPITPSGGTAPFSFVWQKGAAAPSSSQILPLAGTTLTGLDQGNYSITATDGAGVKSVKTVIVNTIPNITGVGYGVSLSDTPPKCPNSKDGSMTAGITTPDGFAEPHLFQWSTLESGIDKDVIVGLDAVGSPYSVTVTNGIGCTTTATKNLVTKQIVIDNKIIKNTTCSGFADGEVIVTAKGGNSVSGNYKFIWSTTAPFSQISATSSINKLKEGIYFLTLSDDNNCEFVDSFEVKPGKVLSMTAQVNDIKCFGDKTGKIEIQGNTANGTPATPYIFQFSPNSAVSNICGTTATTICAGQLAAGKYSVTMSDQDGCSINQKDIEVKQPDEIKIQDIAVSDPTCTGGGKDGFIEIKATGGILAAGNSYKYKWNIPSFTSKISALTNGDFSVTVTDDNGCFVSKDFKLIPPAAPKITQVTVKNVDCSDSKNGSIKINATPATAGDVLTYSWSEAGKKGAEIFDLSPKKYTVSVTDQKGCVTSLDTAVIAPEPLVLVDTILTQPTCHNDKNGSISIEMKGGTPSYKFLWESGGVIKEVTDLKKGILPNLEGALYTISVEDSKGCKGAIYNINLPRPIITKVQFSDLKDISCTNSDKPDGQVKCTVIQGNIPNAVYSFTWSDNITDTGTESFRKDLSKGPKFVTVTDGVCPIVDSVFIGFPTKVGVDSAKLEITNISCVGKYDGAAIITGIGGTPPYKYQWSTSDSGPSIKDQTAGDYIYTITDDKGCAYDNIIKISAPDTLKAVKDFTAPNPTKDLSCNNVNDGALKLKVTGGTPGYSFSWTSNVSTTNYADKLSPSLYEVIVTDSKGCTAIEKFQPGNPEPIAFTLDSILSPLCFGYLTDVKIKNVTGGTGSQLGNYTFTVDDGGDANAKDGVIPVYAGKHIVKVYDPDGCYAEQDIDIQDPPAIRVYLGPDVELELGDSHEINAVIEATAPIVKYAWSPTLGLTFTDTCKNDCARLIKPLEDGSFILQITDTIGCTGSDTLNITIDKNRNVYIPNIFTPNVDGTNDFMEVYADPESVEAINYFRIYDRWGNQVFESLNFKPVDSRVTGNRWDGFYDGIKANTGIYIYVCEVKFVDGLVLRFRGDLSLTR